MGGEPPQAESAATSACAACAGRGGQCAGEGCVVASLRQQLDGRTQELHEVKAATMYGVVDTVKVGSETKKLLYMKNADAARMTPDRIPQLLDQMGIPMPNRVVVIMFSTSGNRAFIQSQYVREDPRRERRWRWVTPYSYDDLAQLEQRFIVFARDVLLPIALDTRTLFLVSCSGTLAQSQSCVITGALELVFATIRKQRGDKCPFTILGHGNHYYMHKKSMEKGSYAHRFMNSEGCTIWKQRQDFVHKTLSKIDGVARVKGEWAGRSGVGVYDLSSFPSHYIITEDIKLDRKSVV